MMKRLILIAASTMAFCLAGVAQRLPQTATPVNYNLKFAPDFTHDTFAGNEVISLKIDQPTKEIVLNAADIDFGSVRIDAAGGDQEGKVHLDAQKEFATLSFDKEIPQGDAKLKIAFTGKLNDELRGFYLGKQNDGKKYAVTQFESTDARRAFPCFDEPAYKATYDITVVADKGQTVISNKPVKSDTAGPEGKHTVVFEQTAKMSSYLVAIAVGDFEYIQGSADGIPIRVYTFRGKKEQGAFALEAAQKCIEYYDKYFGVKYPFTKLDLIGLPDFAAGAMENAGAITFREVALLVDKQHASTHQEANVAITVAHEIAHQWFGDLVTMKWWDDIWLNEGFATWMETKPIEAWKPEWHLELGDVQDTNNTMNVDSLANTRPIHQAAETPAQIQELFDGIAYGKAAAVLRMLEAYLGPETFRKGVDSYIKAHSYSNSTAEDFWSALTTASNKPVDRIMPTFVTQPGVPLVAVKSQCNGNETKVTLDQQLYSYDHELMSSSDRQWMIPVCMKSSGKKEQKCELLDKKQSDVTLPGCSNWVLGNADGKGYYHSAYEQTNVKSLAEAMQTSLNPAERIRLLYDEWSAVRVGRGSIGDFMMLADGLKSEHYAAVVEQAIGEINFISDNLVTDNDRPAFQQWVNNLFQPLAKEVGWKPAASDNEDRKELRAAVIGVLGYAGRDPKILEEATVQAHALLKDESAVDPSLRAVVLNLAAIHGDEGLYDEMTAAMKNAKSPEQYYTLGRALSSFGDPALIKKTLDATLTPKVRSQDAPHVMASEMRNPAARQIAWDFVREHWDQISKMLAGYSANSIVDATGSFCDAAQRTQVTDFFRDHPFPTAERSLKQSLERIGNCVDLKNQQTNQVAAWLSQHEGTAGGGSSSSGTK